jgi:hypothetical protein
MTAINPISHYRQQFAQAKGLVTSWLNKTLEEEGRLDVKPFRKFLENAVRAWGIAGLLVT